MIPDPRETAARNAREASFHDQTYSNNSRDRASKYYAVTRLSRGKFSTMLLKDANEKSILEYGCGIGSYAFALAEAGASVTGIDISPVAIAQAQIHARNLGVESKTIFRVMDAEHTTFADQSFDLICGTGILHHLDLRACYKEIARVLKPGGKALFSEPMGHNPLINLYRKLTPKMRTPDEHPLKWDDLKMASQFFTKVETEFFHCFDLSLVPLRNLKCFGPLLSAMSTFDQAVMAAIPPFRRMAWQVTLTLKR